MAREGSILFSPRRAGPVLIPNRFIRSPICWGDADASGLPSQTEIDHLVDLARGGVGLVIPGFMYSLPHGRVFPGQCGFSSDAHASAWQTPVQRIHSLGSKVIFQVAHAGASASPAAIDGTPRGPTGFLPGTRAMTIPEIEELVQSYVDVTKRLVRIGADGLMVHCAHGYGLAQFLSPHSNTRSDKYGTNRAQIVQEILREVKKVAPDDFAIICKINGHDGLADGVTPDLCARYVRLLHAEGAQLFEISTGFLSRMTMSRSDFREGRRMRSSPEDEKQWKENQKMFDPDFPYSEGYTKGYAEIVRRANPGVDLAIVGGNRSFSAMEKLVADGKCEFVSIARPFIRDPHLVNNFRSGKLDVAECASCNQCFIRRPIRCGFPNV